MLIFFVQLEIKIPRVKLSFASKTGLKRIPKKRPADRDASEYSTSTEYYLNCNIIIDNHLTLRTVPGGKRMVFINPRLPCFMSPTPLVIVVIRDIHMVVYIVNRVAYRKHHFIYGICN